MLTGLPSLLVVGLTSVTPTARLRVSCSTVQPVAAYAAPGTLLAEYMQLPVSQYETIAMPLNAELERVAGSDDEFVLIVPPVSFAVPGLPTVSVSPVVRVSVTGEQDRVVIESDECVVHGSEWVESLRLNQLFRFSVRTCFTWDGQGDGTRGEDARGGSSAWCAILSTSALRVDIEPPAPFRRVPRRLLEAVGNAVMRVATEALQREFLRNLAADYERWAADDAYRSQRAEPAPQS